MLALVVLIVGSITGAGVMDTFDVEASAMAPSLLIDDKVALFGFDQYSVGDVVVFSDQKHEADRMLRVVAVAGDTVEATDSQLFVNGEIVIEPYRSGNAYDDFGPVAVGAGEYFLMGDWRSRTVDSRDIGPVPADLIRGRAIWRMWPLTRFGPA